MIIVERITFGFGPYNCLITHTTWQQTRNNNISWWSAASKYNLWSDSAEVLRVVAANVLVTQVPLWSHFDPVYFIKNINVLWECKHIHKCKNNYRMITTGHNEIIQINPLNQYFIFIFYFIEDAKPWTNSWLNCKNNEYEVKFESDECCITLRDEPMLLPLKLP